MTVIVTHTFLCILYTYFLYVMHFISLTFPYYFKLSCLWVIYTFVFMFAMEEGLTSRGGRNLMLPLRFGLRPQGHCRVGLQQFNSALVVWKQLWQYVNNGSDCDAIKLCLQNQADPCSALFYLLPGFWCPGLPQKLCMETDTALLTLSHWMTARNRGPWSFAP